MARRISRRIGSAIRWRGAALAVLIALSTFPVAAWAQTQPQYPGRECVPHTPEALGVTPEALARLNIPADACVEPPRTDGMMVWGPPQLTASVGAAVPLGPDAIVASAAVRIDPRRWRSATAIRIGAPFDVTLPAGSHFGDSSDPAEGLRPCQSPEPYVSHEPADDENGEIYPMICLHDRDAEGRFTRARMLPYSPARARPRDIAIAPVRLEPVPAGVTDAWFPTVFGVRRVRVSAIGPRAATLVLEDGVARLLEEHGRLEPAAAIIRYFVVDSAIVALEPGASVTLGGVTLTVSAAPGGGWRVTPTGGFGNWVGVSANGLELDLGSLHLQPARR